MILVTRTSARLTSGRRCSSGCNDGIEIAGPMNRRNTTLPTPICGAVAFPPNRAAVHTAIWWNISRSVLIVSTAVVELQWKRISRFHNRIEKVLCYCLDIAKISVPYVRCDLGWIQFKILQARIPNDVHEECTEGVS